MEPSPTGFPPKEAKPGAIGEALYSPLIKLPNGVVLNNPQIINASRHHNRLIRIDLGKRVTTFRMTDGFFEGRRVHYTSFNASDPARLHDPYNIPRTYRPCGLCYCSLKQVRFRSENCCYGGAGY